MTTFSLFITKLLLFRLPHFCRDNHNPVNFKFILWLKQQNSASVCESVTVVTWYEQLAACFLSRIMDYFCDNLSNPDINRKRWHAAIFVTFCDDLANPDVGRKLFASIWIFFLKSIGGLHRRIHSLSWHCIVRAHTPTQGRSDVGVYRYIYPPNQSTLNFLCGCFVSLTQDKFDIVQFIPTQIKFLATPLVRLCNEVIDFGDFCVLKYRLIHAGLDCH